MRRCACALAFVATLLAQAPSSAGERATDGWWRVTAHLRAPDDRWFDVYAIFYEFGRARFVAAAFSIVDERTRRTFTATRLDRCADGLASVTRGRAVGVDGWYLRERGERFWSAVADGGTSLALQARAVKAPVADRDGLAFTRLAARATLGVGGARYRATGTAWIDRADSPRTAPASPGWNRFELQYDDGRDVMLDVVRRADGSASAASEGYVVGRDGTVTRLSSSGFIVENPLATTFRSPRTGLRYPSLWEISVARAGIDSAAVPPVQDQEISAASGPAFYAGTLDLERAPPPGGERGRGFVESTGYDRSAEATNLK
jgi:predicted secreted hydrolase